METLLDWVEDMKPELSSLVQGELNSWKMGTAAVAAWSGRQLSLTLYTLPEARSMSKRRSRNWNGTGTILHLWESRRRIHGYVGCDFNYWLPSWRHAAARREYWVEFRR